MPCRIKLTTATLTAALKRSVTQLLGTYSILLYRVGQKSKLLYCAFLN